MTIIDDMARRSAGILMYRLRDTTLEVLLVHPGGPYFAGKNDGAWSVPKGEVHQNESDLDAAKREFHEETSLTVADPLIALGEVKYKGGKTVIAWAFAGDCDPDSVRCNNFKMEWPPKSGKWQEFPEIDKAGFFTLSEARKMILQAQSPLLDRLEQALGN